MLKITAIVTLMFIAGTVWAGGLFCDSCGSECASSCGTRRFRACCFNYLRKKRGPEILHIHMPAKDEKESQANSKSPMFVMESMPESWIANVLSHKNHPYFLEDLDENRLHEA